MGYYIVKDSKGNPLGTLEAVERLVADGATIVRPTKWQENLICVVENDTFDSCGFAYDEREFERFSRPDDRPKTWLTHPLAKKLSGYEK